MLSLLKESLLFTLKLLVGAVKLCYSNHGWKKQTQFKSHSKMSLATTECTLTGFLASIWFLVKLASNNNSIFILNKIKPTQFRLTLNYL